MVRSLKCRTLGVFALASSLAFSAQAAFPDKPVRIVVPYAAGGGTDAIARHLAERLRPRLGQAVIIDNRPGADGVIGTVLVAISPLDGQADMIVVT